MVIQQPLQSALFRAVAGADIDQRHRSRIATLAVMGAVALHLLVGYYVYQARYGGAAQLPTPPEKHIDGGSR